MTQPRRQSGIVHWGRLRDEYRRLEHRGTRCHRRGHRELQRRQRQRRQRHRRARVGAPVSVAYQHVREQALPPSAIDPSLPREVDAIVMKSLAKRVEDRYQSAQAMRTDIERYLAGRPVQATVPPSPSETMVRSGGPQTGPFTLQAWVGTSNRLQPEFTGVVSTGLPAQNAADTDITFPYDGHVVPAGVPMKLTGTATTTSGRVKNVVLEIRAGTGGEPWPRPL